MTRFLLFLLFFVMLAADTLGLNLSLGPGLSVKNAILYLILLSIAIEAALKRNRDLELLSVVLPYALCILYAIFTIVVVLLFIDYYGYSARDAIISLKSSLGDNLVVFLVFFYGALTLKDATWLVKMIIWLVIAGNLISVMDALNIPDLGLIQERRDGRIGGPFGESNQYGAFLTLFLPAVVGLALSERGMRRKLAFAGFAVSVLALLMTVSRGAFVGAACGALLGAFYLRKEISAKLVTSTLGGLAVVGIVAFAVLTVTGYTELLFQRMIDHTFTSIDTASSGRTGIWTDALEKMLEYPHSLITGFGWNSYVHFPFRLAPHNGYLGIFFELGFIGLLLVLAAFGGILRTAREGLRAAIRLASPNAEITLLAFVIGLFSILVAIFFVDLSNPWLFIWAYSGVVMRIAVLQRQAAALSAEETVGSEVRENERGGRFAPQT